MPAVEMVLPSLEMGGMEQVVCRLARGLTARGWRVRVTCTLREGALAAPLRADGVPVQVVPLAGRRGWLGGGTLATSLGRTRPDLVHSHSGVWWRAAAAATRVGIPARVHTVHGLLQHEPWYGPMEKRLASRLTGTVIAVSPSLQEYLLGVARVPAARLKLVPNGVDAERYRPRPAGELRSRLGLSPGAFIIGAVARLDPVKHLEIVPPVVGRLADQGLDAHFVVAGDGPAREHLARSAADSGVSARLHLLGTTSTSDALYPEFDAFVLPSHMEGTSLSLLEAMASAVPCVASAVGGSPAVLDHGKAGILVPVGDVAALGAALARLATDPGLRARLGSAGRARVEAEYSLATTLDRHEAIYRELLAPRVP